MLSYSQFNPPGIKGAMKLIYYYAIVKKTPDIGSVFALVWHPENAPAPYNGSTETIPSPGHSTNASLTCGFFKYKIDYAMVGHNHVGEAGYDATVAPLFEAAVAAHLVIFGDGYTAAEVHNASLTGELDQGNAYLWRGCRYIDYEQPAGDYLVDVYGLNNSGVLSAVVSNYFRYMPMCSIDVDFNGLDFGSIPTNYETQIIGNRVWDTPGWASDTNPIASVRNTGNVWAKVSVNITDMGFGRSGPETHYSSIGNGTTAGVPPGASNMNSYYDFTMGPYGAYKCYMDPGTPIITTNYLDLSTLEKLDFSILVKQASAGSYSGTLYLACVCKPFCIPDLPHDLAGVPDDP